MRLARHPQPNPEAYLEPARDCICFALRKSARAVTQLYDEALRPAGLRATQFTLLVATAVLAPATITRLAGALVMDRTTLTRNLKPLATQGLLEVLPGEDRRERTIVLTARGRGALARALPLWQRAQRHLRRRLGTGRVEALRRSLSGTTEAVQPG